MEDLAMAERDRVFRQIPRHLTGAFGWAYGAYKGWLAKPFALGLIVLFWIIALCASAYHLSLEVAECVRHWNRLPAHISGLHGLWLMLLSPDFWGAIFGVLFSGVVTLVFAWHLFDASEHVLRYICAITVRTPTGRRILATTRRVCAILLVMSFLLLR
jgi:hypothetical protein